MNEQSWWSDAQLKAQDCNFHLFKQFVLNILWYAHLQAHNVPHTFKIVFEASFCLFVKSSLRWLRYFTWRCPVSVSGDCIVRNIQQCRNVPLLMPQITVVSMIVEGRLGDWTAFPLLCPLGLMNLGHLFMSGQFSLLFLNILQEQSRYKKRAKFKVQSCTNVYYAFIICVLKFATKICNKSWVI